MKTSTSNKFVTFILGQTKFAVPVLKTKEIVEYGKITPVPEAPAYVDGVINLRGGVVPVIDLMHRFFAIKAEITEATSIMIVEPEIDGEETRMGLVVDTVKDVLEIKEEHLEPPPKYGSKLKAEYIMNVASFDDDFILILDIDRILSQIEVGGNFTEIAESVKKKKTKSTEQKKEEIIEDQEPHNNEDIPQEETDEDE